MRLVSKDAKFYCASFDKDKKFVGRSELSRFKFDTLSSKILKIPEFNLNIDTILYSTDF